MVKNKQPKGDRPTETETGPKAGYVNVDREQYDAANELLKQYGGRKYAMDNVPALVRRFLADFIADLERSGDLKSAYDKAFEGMPHRQHMHRSQENEDKT